MKRSVGLTILIMALAAGCIVYVPQGEPGSPEPPPQSNQGYYDQGDQADAQWTYDNPDVSDFYSYLGPSGLWVSYPSYGYVWVPRGVGYGWRPYSLGHWLSTDFGWTWMSTERWGWLVYHYGRWGWDVRLGWYWAPGDVWAPAWVAWRWGDAYIGWAPLPPGDDFDMGYGFRRRNWNIPGDHWCFVRGQEFLDPRLDRWIVPRERNISIIDYTRMDVNIRVRNDRVYNDGVDAAFVQRQTNRTVDRYELKDARRPQEARVGTRDVALFRPSVRPNAAARPKDVLAPDQAAVRRAEAPRATGSPTSANPREDEVTAVRRQHQMELQRLNEDQQAEVRTIQRKAEEERAALRTAAEREKASAAAKARIADVQKKQQAEKARIVERHKAEEDQARKARLKEEKH